MTPSEFTDLFFEWVMQQDTGGLHVMLAASSENGDSIFTSTVIGSPDPESRCLDDSIIRLAVRLDSQRSNVTGHVKRSVVKDGRTGELTEEGPQDGSLAN